MKMVFGNVTKGILTQLNAKTKYKVWITASTANKEGERSVLATVETCKLPSLTKHQDKQTILKYI